MMLCYIIYNYVYVDMRAFLIFPILYQSTVVVVHYYTPVLVDRFFSLYLL